MRTAVVHLLRPVGDIGLLHKRHGTRVLDLGQCFEGCAALCLRLERQRQIGLELLQVFLCHRLACQAGEYGLQRHGLPVQHGFHPAHIPILHLSDLLFQPRYQLSQILFACKLSPGMYSGCVLCCR